jgi:hypothetical protein
MMPATKWKVDMKKVEHQKEGGKKNEFMEINQKTNRRLVNINKMEVAITLEIVKGLGHVLAMEQMNKMKNWLVEEDEAWAKK